MIRVAVVGVGWAGRRQVEASRELGEKVVVTCLVDSDEEYLKEQSRELGVAKITTDFEKVLSDPEIDAVSICTPHALHCEQTVAAAEAGKHVLVEKPIAPRVDEATRMIESARKNNVRLYVAENAVYSPMVRWLKQAVENGEYTGEIVSASHLYGFRADTFRYPGRREWLTRPERGGSGTWMLHGIHSTAKVRHVFGEVETAYIGEYHTESFATPEIEGTVSGVLRMRSGLSVTILQTCESTIPDGWDGFRLYGTRGLLRASTAGFRVYPPAASAGALDEVYPESHLSSYALELEAFADYVAEGTPGPTTAESERRTLAVVQAGYESMRTGLPVPIARFGEL